MWGCLCSTKRFAAFGVVAFLLPASAFWGQELNNNEVLSFRGSTITSGRPLVDAANVLQARYGKPVTCEDPLWVWSGDLERRSDTPWFFPLRRTTTLPSGLSPDQTPILDASVLARVLDEYNKLNEAPRFRVLESKFGLHIVPDIVHDASGVAVPAKNLLDAPVTIPRATRTASGHFQAICAAAAPKDATMVCAAIGFGRNWFEDLFAAPGGVLEWGASGVNARDALIDLLEQSATTFSWRLACEPDVTPGNHYCVLQLGFIRTTRTGSGVNTAAGRLEYDRCPQCAPPGRSPGAH